MGDLVLDAQGTARRGLLVRHLVMPGGVSGSQDVLRFIAREISPDTYLNLMDQYRPCYRAQEYPTLERPLGRGEYEAALDTARAYGLRCLDSPHSRW